MARTRLELHEILCGILGSDYVYYRQPSSGLQYPCIKYELAGKDPRYADNQPYINPKRWTLTVIDEDPDSDIPERLEKIHYCEFDRQYQADNLNHFVYTLYY